MQLMRNYDTITQHYFLENDHTRLGKRSNSAK